MMFFMAIVDMVEFVDVDAESSLLHEVTSPINFLVFFTEIELCELV